MSAAARRPRGVVLGGGFGGLDAVQAQREGRAPATTSEELRAVIGARSWEPIYPTDTTTAGASR